VNTGPAATADDVLVTAAGYEQLHAELDYLRTARRAEITEHLRDARDDSDPDNPVLHELLEGQTKLEQRIAVLTAQVAAARVVEPATDGSAGIGSLVRVRHGDTGEVVEYELVGRIEADVENGRVSVRAPVGRALVGSRRGDAVAVETPRGQVELEVLSVRCPERRPTRKAA
jgi:transcription elongation factor GreA